MSTKKSKSMPGVGNAGLEHTHAGLDDGDLAITVHGKFSDIARFHYAMCRAFCVLQDGITCLRGRDDYYEGRFTVLTKVGEVQS
jgi:hypothetical protein